MTGLPWSAALAPFAVGAVLVLAPGLLVGWVAGMRPFLTVALAPAVSLGVVGAASVVGGLLGLPWSIWVVLAAAAVAAALAGGAVRVLRALPGRTGGRGWPGGRAGVLGGAAVVAAGLFSTGLYARRLTAALGSADAVAQSYDTIFHLNAVAFIVANGDASPLAMTMATPGSESGFYPTLWHGLVALVAGATGAGIATATNALVLVATLIVWPLSCLALARTLFGPRPFALAVTLLLAFAFPALPNRLLSFGILYPILLGYAAVPAGLALVLLVLRAVGLTDPARSPGTTPRHWLVPAGLLALVLMGLACAHPSAAIACVILSVCAVLGGVACWSSRYLRGPRSELPPGGGGGDRRERAPRARESRAVGVLALVWAGTLGALALGAATVATAPAFAPLRLRVIFGPTAGLADSAHGMLDLSLPFAAMNGQPVASDQSVPVLAALVLVGLVVALSTPRWRWLGLGYALTGGLWIAAAALRHPLRDVLVTYWYGDQIRLAALLPLLGLPLAVLGVLGLARIATRHAHRRGAVLAGALALLALFDAVSGRLPAARDSFDRVEWMHGAWPGQEHEDLLTPGEAQFLAEVAEIVPEGTSVLTNPWDGGSLLWALEGVDVVFPVGTGTRDEARSLIADHLADVAEDPGVCDALEELNAAFVLTLGPTIWYPDVDPATSRFGFSGLYDLGGGADLVAERAVESGIAQLHRITACE